MKKFRFQLIALALVVSIFTLAACGGTATTTTTAAGGETTSAAPDESTDGSTDGGAAIKIGGIGPLTGAAAVYGNAVYNGSKIALEEINALGDLQFELNFQDDEHDGEKAVNAYNTLKDWGMQILNGTVTTTPANSVTPEAFADRIFTLTPSASSPTVVEGKDNVFQLCFSDLNQGIAAAQYIADNKLGEKIAIIYNNADAYSTGIYEKFVSEAEAKGLEIVSTTTFTDETNDFTVQLTEAQNNGADLLFLPIYYQPASLILSQAQAMSYETKVFGVDGMDGILTLENFDTTLAEGVMLLTPFVADATDERTVSFVEKYKEQFDEVPNQFAADGYDVMYALYEAAKKAGVTADMSAEEINDKLIEVFTSDDFSFDGLTGSGMTWSDTGEVSKEPKGMVIENGAYVGM
ncbi:MAG: branched-chain amino acid transport system substrate-binding protein [Clostridiales bacterium]|jgi:branched-chain amino acid transport system substrate-binding protein|nr:branched-chain amino acid transport system substrate-binding protein [Clostridiales bacterium]